MPDVGTGGTLIPLTDRGGMQAEETAAGRAAIALPAFFFVVMDQLALVTTRRHAHREYA